MRRLGYLCAAHQIQNLLAMGPVFWSKRQHILSWSTVSDCSLELNWILHDFANSVPWPSSAFFFLKGWWQFLCITPKKMPFRRETQTLVSLRFGLHWIWRRTTLWTVRHLGCSRKYRQRYKRQGSLYFQRLHFSLEVTILLLLRYYYDYYYHYLLLLSWGVF